MTGCNLSLRWRTFRKTGDMGIMPTESGCNEFGKASYAMTISSLLKDTRKYTYRKKPCTFENIYFAYKKNLEVQDIWNKAKLLFADVCSSHDKKLTVIYMSERF